MAFKLKIYSPNKNVSKIEGNVMDNGEITRRHLQDSRDGGSKIKLLLQKPLPSSLFST